MTLIPRDDFFDLDKFFEHFWSPSRRQTDQSNTFFSPRVDVHEQDDHYEISAELPGVKKEDIHITLEQGILTLEAETSQEQKEEDKGRVIRSERRYGKFMRTFNLGEGIHDEDISAAFENGVLKLTAPKRKEPAPVQRRIEIQ